MAANIKILGVRIDNFSIAETKEYIKNVLDDEPAQKFLTTLNPEILLKAHRDENYRNILNGADLNICDGFGIKLVALLQGKKIKSRFAGADLVDFLFEIASRENFSVLVLSKENSLSKASEIERAIKEKYPNLSAKVSYFSPSQNHPTDAIIKEAEIVFVNFGAPEQEKFIFKNRSQFLNGKLLVGVGGTFDFLTGRIRRAPRIIQRVGLEWLWRLFQEPKRFRRIMNATIVFPFAALAKTD